MTKWRRWPPTKKDLMERHYERISKQITGGYKLGAFAKSLIVISRRGSVVKIGGGRIAVLNSMKFTLGDKLAESNGRPSGFDYMRIMLASSVICWHTIVVTYGKDFQDSIWITPKYRLLIAWILPAFFALSGFLVAGSLERSKTILSFLYLRLIRIFPALVTETFLSAFLLGPLLTNFSITEYFSNNILYTYLLNCFGNVHYHLPGLFERNPSNVVNGQLWTVPFELECYVVLSILRVIGILRHHRFYLLTIAGLVSYGILKYVRGGASYQDGLGGYLLVLSFLIGVFFYLNRSIIPYRWYFGVLSIVVSLIFCVLPGGNYLLPLPMTYATIYIGLLNPTRIYLLETGDYSYGIFLYGFPIQQAVVAIGVFPQNGIITLLVAFPLILALAVFSWHLWEKKMLELRKYRDGVDRLFRRSVAVAGGGSAKRPRETAPPAPKE